MKKRIIQVYCIRGGKYLTITTSVDTWGKLKILLKNKHDFSTKGLIAAEDITKHDLRKSTDKIPKVDFMLFLRPSPCKAKKKSK